jgi:PKD repeat protein
MKNILIFLFSLLLMGQNNLFAQNNYKVLLQGGTFVPVENGAAFAENPSFSQEDVIQGRAYRVVQFYNLPTEAEHQALKAADIKLLAYLPHYAYLVSLPANVSRQTLQQFGIRGVFEMRVTDKLAAELQAEPYPDWAVTGDKIELTISYHEDLNATGIETWVLNQNYTMLFVSKESHTMNVLVPVEDLEKIAGQPFVNFVEPVAPPAKPEDSRAVSLHRSNVANGAFPGAPKYDGTGVKVMVRDDGLVGPHIDYQGRLENLTTRSGDPIHHGDRVAGCMTGAGNYDPTIVGMAPGADLTVIRYAASFNDNTLPLHRNSGVVITNSSFSDGCNSGYNSRARTVDQQIFDNPTLMHVFSAGNDGTENCNYGAGSDFGNITGGHKSGKNTIAVGSVDPFSILSGFSSKGPVTDGRLKPEVVAMGQNYVTTLPDNTFINTQGTSFSAPAAAGVAAQFYHAYAALNGGETPPSGLIKAVLTTSANDLGVAGPDYRFGFGLVNAGEGIKILENNQYFIDTLPLNSTNTHSIQIPANVAEARIMLYWPDHEAFAGASKALINDLNISVEDGASITYLPLVLDPTPNSANLSASAQPKVDTLNNIEEVVLYDPAAGNYTVSVNGAAQPFGALPYYVVYAFRLNEITMTHPMGGESFEPSEAILIRWDAQGRDTTFNLDFTSDNGRTWNNIVTGLQGTARHYTWSVPNTVTGQARVRITRGAQVDESDANFTIINTPGNIQFARVCQDFLTMTWDAVPGATSYDVFVLGEKYMDSVGNTPGTFFEPKIRYQDENWFSVRARGDSGIIGRRAIAVRSNPGTLVNCAAVPPVAIIETDTVVCVSQRVFLKDLSTKSPDSWGWTINPPLTSFTNGTTPTSQNPVIVFTQPDTFTVTLAVNNIAGSNATSRRVIVVPPAAAGFTTTTNGTQVDFNNISVNGTSYHWDFGDGDSSNVASPTHSYAAPGNYTVTLTVSSPCGDKTETREVQAWNTSIEDAFEGLQVSLTPNPNNGQFNLSLSGKLANQYEIQLLDLQGKSLFTESISTYGDRFVKAFDFSQQAAGLYFLRLSDGVSVGTLKVVIE